VQLDNHCDIGSQLDARHPAFPRAPNPGAERLRDHSAWRTVRVWAGPPVATSGQILVSAHTGGARTPPRGALTHRSPRVWTQSQRALARNLRRPSHRCRDRIMLSGATIMLTCADSV
jgi:hypothetical protein